MVGGEDDCPWHGFGTSGSNYVQDGKRELEITAATQEILPRYHNGCDFSVEQRVLLRWQAGQKYRHLMWVPGHAWRNNGGANYTPASLQLEEQPQTASLYTPKVILEKGRLSRAYLMYHAAKISRESGLPRDVIEALARIYRPGMTYYLIGDER